MRRAYGGHAPHAAVRERAGTVDLHLRRSDSARIPPQGTGRQADTRSDAAHRRAGRRGGLPDPEPVDDKKVAIVGGGPTGIAAAYFLGREGVPTTIFERERKLGGVPRYVIPAFRISDEAIDKDVALMERYGVEVKLG